MKSGPIAQFILIGIGVGMVAPFFLSLCLFGSTLPVFLSAQPTPGFWSGAPTPSPTPIPSRAQVVANAALHRGGPVSFVLVSVLGALAGEALGARLPGHAWHRTRRAILG